MVIPKRKEESPVNKKLLHKLKVTFEQRGAKQKGGGIVKWAGRCHGQQWAGSQKGNGNQMQGKKRGPKWGRGKRGGVGGGTQTPIKPYERVSRNRMSDNERVGNDLGGRLEGLIKRKATVKDKIGRREKGKKCGPRIPKGRK